MTDLRTAAQQLLGAICAALPYAPHRAEFDVVADTADALRAALAQQAEPALQTCNCRWDGDVQVQQCTLHEAHVDAIHEWAERAKVAERKLAQQADTTDPGHDVDVLREHVRHLERRVRELHAQQAGTVPMPPFPPVSQWNRGCAVCGIGADGKAYGYVCSRSDCPTKVTCGGVA